MPVTAVLASMASVAPVAPRASMASMVWMASIAPMASMASMSPMASMASMVLASMASMVGVTALRWRDLRNETLVHATEDLVVMRWSYNSGKITDVYVLGQNTPKMWLCSSTKLAWDADGSRSSRRVDDVKELMGCQIWAMVVSMASMASMVWMAQGALTWKSLCVTSSDGDTHSGSFAFRLNSLQNTSGICPCVAFSTCDSLLRILLTGLLAACVSVFTVFDQFVMIVYFKTVILTAVLCCL